jgi:formylglycine-generating enzyme required for sulfatase activity
MKRLLLTLILSVFFLSVSAQDFEIISVESLPADMSAREEMKTDHNDRQCALLRIATQNITPEKREGFTFKPDLGSEVVDRSNRNGEILLWVSPGLKYLLIMHRDWGQYELRLPDYVARIEALHTYKVTIKGTFTIAPQVQSDASTTQQYLVFQLTPPNATLEVDDQLWSVDADGTAMKYVNFGSYTYRVRASDYFTETGKVTVDDPNNTKIVTVSLELNFATITLKVDADAEIWVNNVKKGVRSWTGQLGSGTYKIECKMANHETSMVSKEITAEMNGQSVILPAPKPIYGSLNVESTPNLCKLFIDGKEVGLTPKSIPEILIGRHVIRLTKEGYKDYTETITIAKVESTPLIVTLEKENTGRATSNEEIRMTQPSSNNYTRYTNDSDLSFTVNGTSFTMKFVEGGSFQMGGNSISAENDETPIHNVSIESFYMGEIEVTQALWEAVMGTNPSYYKGVLNPVDNVNWYDCHNFIKKLNHLTGKKFRLPTEAEWEFAARGGKFSKGCQYAGSDKMTMVGWCKDNSDMITHPSQGKQPNEIGLYDMSGNVWEWCSDYFGSYRGGFQKNPTGPSSGSSRVLRGGCVATSANKCRVSARIGENPSNSARNRGFRLALSE